MGMKEYYDTPCCKDCNRAHEDTSPCPTRIARALTVTSHLPLRVLRLTDADKAWIQANQDFNTVKAVENCILELLR